MVEGKSVIELRLTTRYARCWAAPAAVCCARCCHCLARCAPPTATTCSAPDVLPNFSAATPPSPRCPCCANPLPAGADKQLCGACSSHRPPSTSRWSRPITRCGGPTGAAVEIRPPSGAGHAVRPAVARCRAAAAGLCAAGAAMPGPTRTPPAGRTRLQSSPGNRQALARSLGVALQPRLAVRLRDTTAQSSVAPDQPSRNIAGAFAIPDAALVEGRHIGIVDDVMTSGRTLNELAATLKRHGAARVSNLVFAPHAAPLNFKEENHLVSRRTRPAGNPAQHRQRHPLCANTGAQLHLIEPLGFRWRIPSSSAPTGLPRVRQNEGAQGLASFLADVQPDPARMYAMTTHGSSPFANASFQPGDVFVFGSETRGLDPAFRETFPPAQRIRPADASRQPQPEPVEHGRRGGVRGLAPERLRRRRLTPADYRSIGSGAAAATSCCSRSSRQNPAGMSTFRAAMSSAMRSGRLAPGIAAATAGLASENCNAAALTGMPCFSAIALMRATLARSPAMPADTRSACRRPGCRNCTDRRRRYRPVAPPRPASGAAARVRDRAACSGPPARSRPAAPRSGPASVPAARRVDAQSPGLDHAFLAQAGVSTRKAPVRAISNCASQPSP